MRVHFWRRHVRDTVIILEEGNLPHPRCEECDMLVPWRSLNGRHKATDMCKSGAIKKQRRGTTRHHHPPQVGEPGDRLKLFPVDPEGHLRALSDIRLR